MNLNFLQLSDNRDLVGEFPIEICDLVELETLGIGDTSIEGIITSLILNRRKYSRLYWESETIVVFGSRRHPHGRPYSFVHWQSGLA
jgi:hypothetical protein